MSEVFLAFDGDKAGRGTRRRLPRQLKKAGVRAVKVDLPDEKDLADQLAEAEEPGEWLAEALIDADAAAGATWRPTPEPEQRGKTSWAPLDLTPCSRAEAEKPRRSSPRRRGLPVLPEKLHSAFGEPEGCKGWLALAGGAQVIQAGLPVLYIDFEDHEATIVSRLLALGCRPGQIGEWLPTSGPTNP